MNKHIIISLAALSCTATILQPATGLASQSFSISTAISEETHEEILPDEPERLTEENNQEISTQEDDQEIGTQEEENDQEISFQEEENLDASVPTEEQPAEPALEATLSDEAEEQPAESAPEATLSDEAEEQPAESDPEATLSDETEEHDEVTDLPELEESQETEPESEIPDCEDASADEPETEISKPEEEPEPEPIIPRPPLVIPELTDLPFEFRFLQNSEAEPAVIPGDTWIYEEASRQSEAVGYSSKEALVYILADGSKEWAFVESGRVRGFVKTSDLIRGQQLTEYLNQENLELSGFQIKDKDGMPWEDAETCLSPLENDAMTYTKTTAYDPVADKVYAIAGREGAWIYDSPEYDDKQQVVGFLDVGAVAYILADADADMIFVESGDVRGFADADSLRTGAGVEAYLLKQGDGEVKTAEVRMDPKENRALCYTVTSTKAADTSVYLRNDLVTYALQFVGNPYVYGGNSLTDGIDCSGFVQQIYRNFGYQLERTADAQSRTAGVQIPTDCALPGDIICYSKGAEVYHVSIYIGNGKTVQAANSKAGIIVTNSIGNNAAWACRVLP